MKGLPPVLREIAEVTSLRTALALADARGGTRVTFPERPGDEHWLVKLIGRDDAIRLHAHFGADHIELPLGAAGSYRAFLRSFYQRLDTLEAEGLSEAAIARAAGTTERTVRRARARRRQHNSRVERQERLL